MMRTFKQGVRTLIFGGVAGSLITYYNFTLIESNFSKKEILIKNLRKKYELEGLTENTNNNNSLDELSNSLKLDDAVVIPFFYHTYKDYILLSFSNFFVWLGKSDSKYIEFKQFIFKKFN